MFQVGPAAPRLLPSGRAGVSAWRTPAPAQAIAAATINAAAALGRQAEIGSLEPGKQADVLVLGVPDYRQLGYRFGINLVARVIKRGRIAA